MAHGTFDKTSETIETYLAENRAHVVYSTSDARRGRLSKTSYRVLEQAKHFALLEIDLLTGRKHQIRAHLADIGHPVVGDKKYGRDERGQTRLALHAKSIAFAHPFDGQPLTIETPLPPSFRALMRAGDARQLTSGSLAPRARRSPCDNLLDDVKRPYFCMVCMSLYRLDLQRRCMQPEPSSR